MGLEKPDVSTNRVERGIKYARDVEAGEIVAGRYERLAVARFLRDHFVREADPKFGFVFDRTRAERACRFIESLPHIKGDLARRNETIRLEGWQSFIIANLFGWVERVTLRRRFRTAYIEVARKNAKSTLLSGVGLYCLALDGEAGAEVYSAATTKDQARLIFDGARQMALRHPDLQSLAGVTVQKHEIRQDRTGSVFKPKAAQTDSLDGDNPSCALIDELHEHRNRKVLDSLRNGMGARSQPLEVSITTAGVDIAGVCYAERDFLVKVLESILDDERHFGMIFAVDEEDDAFDPGVWRKANPNLGVSVDPENLANLAHKAKHNPTSKGDFLRKRCGIWSAAGASAFDLDGLRARVEPELALKDLADLADLHIGIDGSRNDDLTSVCVMGWRGEDLVAWDEHFGTEEVIEAEGAEYLRVWRDAGLLTQIDGSLIDMTLIEKRILEIARVLDLRRYAGRVASGARAEICYDALYCGQMASNLEKILAPEVEIVEQPQKTLALDPALRLAQGLIRDRRIVTRGNPVLMWNASNARVKNAGEFRKLFKQQQASKIDGMQALLTGLARMEAPEEKSSASYLASAGLIVI